jgi:membrane fusion protein (multidrug efflux system)
VAIVESHARVTRAETEAQFAKRQAERSARLRQGNAISPEEFERHLKESTASQAAVVVLTRATDRLEQDRLAQESDRKVRLAKLDREAVELAGDIAIEEAAIRRLEHDIEMRIIRAPVSGRVGEAVADFRVGSVVRAADRLGAIVPAGEARAVALFPAASIGRLHPGQPARLRLDGFPWTQYGTIPATVADVGNEASNGLIRVELALAPDFVSPIPLEHGPPGSVEVEVESVSPAVLTLRAAGQLQAAKRLPTSGGKERSEP